MKKYMIEVMRISNGATVQSLTNNPEKRILDLKYNIESINGRGVAVFERFNDFKGADLNDVSFTVWERV